MVHTSALLSGHDLLFHPSPLGLLRAIVRPCRTNTLDTVINLIFALEHIVSALLNEKSGGDLQKSFKDGSAWSTRQCVLSASFISNEQ